MKLTRNELQSLFTLVNVDSRFPIDSTQISSDTRKIDSGTVFFAIKGLNFDGNSFVKEAHEKGAIAAFCSKTAERNANIPLFLYDDDKEALYILAKHILSKTNAKRIAITGSNGKTTTKEILHSLLSSKWKTLKTLGNFNNNIGLPLTLFKLTEDHEAMAIEIGMNALNEIDHLSKLFRPEISIITNVARAHLEFLKTIENIAKAKCEIIPNTSDKVIINGDCDPLMKEALKHKGKTLKFSLVAEADIYVKKFIKEDISSSTFELKDNVHNEELEITIPLPGRHNISNFLGAYLAARLSGIPASSLKNASSNLKPFHGRFESTTAKGINIINDCYNANPDSMIAGLESFLKIPAKRKIALLGDMNELGDNSEQLHYDIGTLFSNYDIDQLITFGEKALKIEEGARNSGFLRTKKFTEFPELVNYIKSYLQKDDYLYIKASNTLKLDRVIDELKDKKEK